MLLGENIKKCRKAKEITQSRLATLTDKSISTIKKYENNNIIPDIKTLKKLSVALGITLFSLEQFIGGKDNILNKYINILANIHGLKLNEFQIDNLIEKIDGMIKNELYYIFVINKYND